ncbi:MAG: 50S ribosomal protein L7ae-like protein [Tissierellia bacterium]|nr:50S ribosomal protein L7ae-like protein [Tissierellia bacterium]
MVSRLATDNKVVGTRQVKRALAGGKAEVVYIAEDADRKITQEIIQLCNEKQVEIVYVESMKKLGEFCKIEVSAASAALLK